MPRHHATITRPPTVATMKISLNTQIMMMIKMKKNMEIQMKMEKMMQTKMKMKMQKNNM